MSIFIIYENCELLEGNLHIKIDSSLKIFNDRPDFGSKKQI